MSAEAFFDATTLVSRDVSPDTIKPDSGYYRHRDTVFLREMLTASDIAGRVQYFANVLIRQLSVAVRFTWFPRPRQLRQSEGSVPNTVRHVFAVSRPIEIVGGIVQAVAVNVRGLMFRGWGRPVGCRANKPVNLARNFLTRIQTEYDGLITTDNIRLEGPTGATQAVRIDTFDIAKAGNRVVRSLVNHPPFFGSFHRKVYTTHRAQNQHLIAAVSR